MTPDRLGRERVIELATAAAARAFEAGGLAAVSLRQVAREVGVDHALIHRYFGGREGLVKATVRKAAEEAAFRASSAEDPAEVFSTALVVAMKERAAVRVLARAILDGLDMSDADASDNAAERAVRLLSERRGHDADLSDRALVAAATALVLGWVLFEDWVVAAAGLGDADTALVQHEVERIVRRLVSS